MSIKTIKPTNGEILSTYEEMSKNQVTKKLENAHEAWLQWKKTSFSHRAEKMNNLAKVLKEKKKFYADLMTEEMGKVFKDGISEIEKCAWVCEYYADKAEEFLQNDIVNTDASRSYASFQPLGLILAVMPWNFPFWQVFRFAAPSLMAGNGGVLKHASNVSGCSLAIEDIFEKAGFPKNLFTSLLIETDEVNKVIEHPLIKAVTLTGSVRAGKAVAEAAGRNLKKTVLELGGSDAYVILNDADIKDAAEICVNSRMLNSGQSCIAAKRFLVTHKNKEKFTEAVLTKMKALKVGDPYKDDTDIGPMAKQSLRDDLHDQVERSIEDGAKCLLGGNIPEGKGAYYPATLLSEVTPGMAAFDEELFGPVASIISAETEEEIIELANQSQFGLGAAVITSNKERGEKIANERLDAGCCFVNAFVKSDPRLPFGGIKNSGFGRELGSYGIKEFVNIKTVYVK